MDLRQKDGFRREEQFVGIDSKEIFFTNGIAVDHVVVPNTDRKMVNARGQA